MFNATPSTTSRLVFGSSATDHDDQRLAWRNRMLALTSPHIEQSSCRRRARAGWLIRWRYRAAANCEHRNGYAHA